MEKAILIIEKRIEELEKREQDARDNYRDDIGDKVANSIRELIFVISELKINI